MGGWRYEWAGELQPEVYEVILEEMEREAKSYRKDDDGDGAME